MESLENKNKRIDPLKKEIMAVVNKNIGNKKLIRATKDEFLKKGFNINIPNLLWSDSINIDELNIYEIMAISKVIKEKLEDGTFSLKRFFSNGEIEDYNNLINKEEKVYSLYLDNVVKLTDKDFHCVITAEQLSIIRKNGLVGYFRKYQRAGIESKTTSGRIINQIAINKQGVLQMQRRFLEKLKDKKERKYPDIRPTSIAFTVLIDEFTDIRDSFIFREKSEDNKNIGSLYIKPDFDIENESGLRLIISDGMHRMTALANAYDIAKDQGKFLDEKIGLYIHLMNPIEARQYLYDTFERNDTDLDYLKSIKVTEDSEFIYKFERDSKWINGHVAMTKRELNIDKNYVEQKTLIEGFEGTDIKMTSDSVDAVDRERVANIVDDILDYALSEAYSGDEKEFNNSIFLRDEMFKLYIRFAARVRKTKYLSKILDLILEIQEYENTDKLLSKKENDSVFEEIIDKVVD